VRLLAREHPSSCVGRARVNGYAGAAKGGAIQAADYDTLSVSPSRTVIQPHLEEPILHALSTIGTMQPPPYPASHPAWGCTGGFSLSGELISSHSPARHFTRRAAISGLKDARRTWPWCGIHDHRDGTFLGAGGPLVCSQGEGGRRLACS